MPRKFLSRGQLIVMLIIFIVVSALGSSIYLAFQSARTVPQTAMTISSLFVFSISIDRNSYRQFQQGIYDNVSITLTLRNINNRMVSVAWDSYYSIGRKIMLFDILITDSKGVYVYKLSHVHYQTGSQLERTIEPKAQLSCLFAWQQWTDNSSYPFAERGTYLVRGETRNMYVTLDGAIQTVELETPTLSFTIV